MWHEARKHEKKLRGMMVDYRRRAERRREFYESIRRDPASFLQIHGQQMRVHIDPAISQAAESSLMPWMGDTKNMIDRFDVRAHLDYIPTSADVSISSGQECELTSDQEGQLNYERFRNLVQSDFLNVTEAKHLNQIYEEERWEQNSALKQKSQHELKKKLAEKKAAIGYTYEDSENSRNYSAQENNNNNSDDADSDSEGDEEEFEDMDTTVHIDQLNDEMRHRIGQIASKFGVKDKLFIKFLNVDKEEAEKLRIAKEIENEKSMFVGRKSRRERKELKQQRLLILRSINVDDSASELFGRPEQKNANTNASEESSDDEDGSNKSDIDEGKVEFITCFGSSSDDEDIVPNVPQNMANKKTKLDKKDKPKKNKTKSKSTKEDTSKNSVLPMFGPSLPGQKEIGHSSMVSGLDIKFNSTINLKNRHYRFSRRSDDEEIGGSVRERTPIQEIYRRGRSSERRRRGRSSSSDSPERQPSSRNASRRNRSSLSRSRSRNRSHGRVVSSSHRSSHARRRSRSRDLPSRYKRKSRSRSRDRSSRRYRSSSRPRSDHHRHRSRSKSRDRKRATPRNRSPVRSPSTSKGHKQASSRSTSSADHHKDNNNKSINESKPPSEKPDHKSLSPKEVKYSEAPKKLEIASILEPPFSVLNVLPHSIPMPPEPEPTLEPKLQVKPVSSLQPPKVVEPPPIRRYYRHDLAEKDGDLSNEDEDEEMTHIASKGESLLRNSKANSLQSCSLIPHHQSKCTLADSSTVGKVLHSSATTNTLAGAATTSSNNAAALITPQERLRRLMQAQLDKEYKRDKKAEAQKLEKQKQEKLERAEEMHKITNRLNERRYRGQRDRSRSMSYSSSDTSDSSDSSSDQRNRRRRSRHKASRSRSRSRPRHHRSRSRSPVSRGSRRYRSRSYSR